jgi:hypothetical protein
VEGLSFSRGLSSSQLSRPFPNRSDLFSPVGCRVEFLSKKVSVVLWLFLFKGGEVLEAGRVFGEFLDRTGLTGLPNWSHRFPLPV